jgi:hypothetical protein
VSTAPSRYCRTALLELYWSVSAARLHPFQLTGLHVVAHGIQEKSIRIACTREQIESTHQTPNNERIFVVGVATATKLFTVLYNTAVVETRRPPREFRRRSNTCEFFDHVVRWSCYCCALHFNLSATDAAKMAPPIQMTIATSHLGSPEVPCAFFLFEWVCTRSTAHVAKNRVTTCSLMPPLQQRASSIASDPGVCQPSASNVRVCKVPVGLRFLSCVWKYYNDCALQVHLLRFLFSLFNNSV